MKFFGIPIPFTGKSAEQKGYERGYAAAKSRAQYGDFRATSGSADYEIRGGLRMLRNKARYLSRNSASITRFLRLLEINVVGPMGFRFQSRVRKQDGEMDAQLNRRVEEEFSNWWSRPSACGQLSGVDLTKQGLNSLARDGEILWEIVKNPLYTDGIAINPVETDLLDETLNTVAPGTKNQIRMGVEVDKYNRPVAYHLLTQHPGDTTWFSHQFKKTYRRVPAENIIHYFRSERAGQTRGAPWIAAVMNSIKMLDGYREAETMNRRIAASVMGFFKKAMPTKEGIPALADREDEDRALLEMDVEPGKLRELPEGLDFEKFDPGGSQTDYHSFESQVKKDISMGLMISAMSHGMETQGVSYSAGRTITLEDQEFYRDVQASIIDRVLKPIFGMWLSMRVLQVSSDLPPTRIEAIRKSHVFRGRGWHWVDPAKDVKGHADALKTYQTSLARVAAERGIDRDDLLDEIEEDQRAAQARGLTLSYDTGNTAANTSKGEDDDDPVTPNSEE